MNQFILLPNDIKITCLLAVNIIILIMIYISKCSNKPNLYFKSSASVVDIIFLRSDFWGHCNFLSSKTQLIASLFLCNFSLFIGANFFNLEINSTTCFAVFGASLTYNYLNYFKKWQYLASLYNQYLNATDRQQSDYIKSSLVCDILLMGFWNHSSFQKLISNTVVDYSKERDHIGLVAFAYEEIKNYASEYCDKTYKIRYRNGNDVQEGTG